MSNRPKTFGRLNKTAPAFFVPAAVAAVYGSLTIYLSSAFAEFVDRIGPMETLQFIGFALSAFGAVALWPALIQFGRGVPYRELQRRLKESEEAAKKFQSIGDKLQDEVHSYSEQLKDSNQRFQLVLKSFNIATFYCDRDHRYEWAHNFGGNNDHIIGKKDEDILGPDSASVLTALKMRALEEERLQEGQITIPENGEDKQYLVQVAPRYDRDNTCIGTLSVSTDITEKSLWHQHLLLMIDEVNHRARNMLTVILSILNLTSKSATSADSFYKKIYGRVMALSVGHTLISENSWTSSSLRCVAERIIKKSAKGLEGTIDILGDDVHLSPKATQNMAMALHELIENAKEYGALSQMGGRVELTWEPIQTDTFDGIRIRWSEHAAFSIQQPMTKGFGLKTLEHVLFDELQGRGQSFWTPEGLVFEIRLPNAVLVSERAHQDARKSFVIDTKSKQRIEYAA